MNTVNYLISISFKAKGKVGTKGTIATTIQDMVATAAVAATPTVTPTTVTMVDMTIPGTTMEVIADTTTKGTQTTVVSPSGRV